MTTPISAALVAAAHTLSDIVGAMQFAPPITHVYNPLEYAWDAHRQYLERFGNSRKRVVFVGMNPGPFGMVQTGVPFGEVATVRDWMKIEAHIGRPAVENPKRPIEGFACERSEVSGRRLWGLFAQRFVTPAAFFDEHFVANYCPLAFFEHARNFTPDKLPATEQRLLVAACDAHLKTLVETLEPEWVIGVGAWAETRAREVLVGHTERTPKIGRVLHPSPASPIANKDWAGAATKQLEALWVW